MVRLKDDESVAMLFAAIFQFLYGAIKSIKGHKISLYAIPFQFLYGAIKRVWIALISLKLPIFQFLYGAIKSDVSRVVWSWSK